MSTHQQSKPRRANQSMTDESGRPSTCKSKVGCDAIDEPCTNRMVPAALFGSPPHFSNMNSFTLSCLLVQCSSPRIAAARVESFIVHLLEIVAIAIPAERGRVASETSGGCRANLTCVVAECDATTGIAERVAGRGMHEAALHLFVHCAKGRDIRPAARIRLILGQIGARPLHAG